MYINKCADECISEQHKVDVNVQPMKAQPDKTISEYFILIYYTDFDFVTVTYNGKVKQNAKKKNL